MDKQQITDEAIKYCSHIDFTDDKNLSEKGRLRVKEWAKQDFIAGAEWMQEQLRLSGVSIELPCNHNWVQTGLDGELYCGKCYTHK